MLVEFKIDNKIYKIECPADDKKKVLSLAKIIDGKAQKLRSHLRSADEKTLLAILCLTLQDEAEKAGMKEEDSSNISAIENNINQEALSNINQVTKKIEDLAKKIERY